MHPSRLFTALCLVWVVAMAWHLYPGFKDTLRIDGRLVSFDDYVEESCGQRVGPTAAVCIQEARETGRRLLAREQGKSVLLIDALPFGYLVVYLPLSGALRRLRRRPEGLGSGKGVA